LVHGQAIPVVACGGWIQMMQRHHRYAGASCADNAKLPNENLPRHILRRQFSFELRLPTLGNAVESNQKKKVHIDGEFHASEFPRKKKSPSSPTNLFSSLSTRVYLRVSVLLLFYFLIVFMF
jgi:hypothetical protein